MPNEEFERRIKMIDAAEAGDDRTLGALIREDVRLESYSVVLVRAALSQGGNAALLDRLLHHPALDQDSPVYKTTVANVFAAVAAGSKTPDPEILKLLFGPIGHNQSLKDWSLRSIFSAVASDDDGHQSVEAARMLVENGADLEKALSSEEDLLAVQKRTIDRKLDALHRFKARVAGP